MIADLIRAAEGAGKIIVKYFGKELETTSKGSNANFFTIADTEAEQEILKIIQKSKLGKYNILAEECGKIDNKSEYTIIIDPLDGTNNFQLGIPNFSISIAVLKGEEIIAGVIHIPLLHDTYVAEKGKGAFKNGKRISVNNETSIQNSTISYLQGYANLTSNEQKNIVSALREVKYKRVMTDWSPVFDYCLLASGKIEGIITNQIEVYDFAVGKLLVKEAGGIVRYLNQDTSDLNGTFIASNSSEKGNSLLRDILNKYIE